MWHVLRAFRQALAERRARGVGCPFADVLGAPLRDPRHGKPRLGVSADPLALFCVSG